MTFKAPDSEIRLPIPSAIYHPADDQARPKLRAPLRFRQKDKRAREIHCVDFFFQIKKGGREAAFPLRQAKYQSR